MLFFFWILLKQQHLKCFWSLSKPFYWIWANYWYFRWQFYLDRVQGKLKLGMSDDDVTVLPWLTGLTKGQEAFFCSKNSWEGGSHQFWFKWSWYIHMGSLQPITTQKVYVHAYRWLNLTIGGAKLAAFLVIFIKWDNLLLKKSCFFKTQIVVLQIISGALDQCWLEFYAKKLK